MKVLIVGGGIGGLCTAKGLRKNSHNVEILLIEPKDYLEILWAAYRSPFDKETAKSALLDLNEFCSKHQIEHRKAVVTKLTASQATILLQQTTTSDETTSSSSNIVVVDFDVCVVATGCDYNWEACGRGIPKHHHHHDGSKEARLQMMQQEGERLVQKSVVIVGGGLIGTELAGEVAYYQKLHNENNNNNVQVTLVQSGAQLVPEMSPGAGKMVQDKLEKMGVKIILNDRVIQQQNDGKAILESSGEELQAEEVVMTVGNKAINEFVEDKSWLNDKGWLQVDEFFRVKGAGGTVFAVGDCCDLLPNSANKIFPNAGVLGGNISKTLQALADKKDLSELELQKYSEMPFDVFVATLGPKDGVAQVGSWLHTQYILPSVKNSTMFFFKIKGDLGFQ